ncbi:MAG: adenosylmethionine decarboxylase [Eubacteriaceae bacterium]
MRKNYSNKKLKLFGFNNLTKTLSFNIYDICYTKDDDEKKAYIEYIDEHYNSNRLMRILSDVCDIIGASILSVSKQDYEPQGASVTFLISEEEVPLYVLDKSCNKGSLTNIPSHIAGHLDKSHLTVHSYPESHPGGEISTFRVDIEVSTCGEISPLKALEYLINSFDSDIIIADYKVRGFTRDINGKKHFIDHGITSIQNYISEKIKRNYSLVDVNVYQENIFHTKMVLKELNLNNYLFNIKESMLPKKEKTKIENMIKKEMLEIFYGRNMR